MYVNFVNKVMATSVSIVKIGEVTKETRTIDGKTGFEYLFGQLSIKVSDDDDEAIYLRRNKEYKRLSLADIDPPQVSLEAYFDTLATAGNFKTIV